MVIINNMLFYVLIASVVVFLFSLFPVTDFDIWWHLTGGQFMLENWQFPYQDTFSYTANGANWYPNSWGFTALSYAIYSVIGLDGLNILKAFMPAFIFLVISFYLYREKLLNLFSLSFIVFALFAIRSGFSLRPHTFAYLFFTIFIALLFSYKKHHTLKLIAALAFTQFIWTNVHASFIWGVALTGIFVFFDLLKAESPLFSKLWWQANKRTLLLGMSILAASLAHVFYGPAYLIRIVTEFLSPSTRQLPVRDLLPASTDTFLSLAGIVLLLGCIVLFFSLRNRQFDIITSTIFLTIATLLSARFIRDLVLFLTFTIPIYIPLLYKKLPQKWDIHIPGSVSKAMFFFFLFGIFLIAKNTAPGIGLGQEKNSYPARAVEFLQSELILEKSNGNLYHTYNVGGYLMWNNQPHKVFIDGRVRPYLAGPFAAYWNNFEGGEVWRDSQERYHITAALMTLPHISGGTKYNDSTPMFPKEEWALIYSDDIAMIYVKRIEALADLIAQYEYNFINPQSLDVSYIQQYIQSQEDFDAVVQEIQQALLVNPESARLHFTLAYTYSLAGLQNQMRDELQKALQINPRFESAKNILNQLESN